MKRINSLYITITVTLYGYRKYKMTEKDYNWFSRKERTRETDNFSRRVNYVAM